MGPIYLVNPPREGTEEENGVEWEGHMGISISPVQSFSVLLYEQRLHKI